MRRPRSTVPVVSHDPAAWLVAALAGFVVLYSAWWAISLVRGPAPVGDAGASVLPGLLVTVEVAILVFRRRVLPDLDRRVAVALVTACLLYWLSSVKAAEAPPVPGFRSPDAVVSLALLACFPAVGFGIMALSKAPFDRSQRFAFVLDQAIVAWGSAMLLWHLVLYPIGRTAGADAPTVVLAAASPSIDVGLVFLAIAMAGRPVRFVSQATAWYLVAALVCVSISDLAYAVESISDVSLGLLPAVAQAWFWLLGAVILYSLQRPSSAIRPPAARPISFGWLPYLMIVVAFVVPAISSWNDLEMLQEHIPASLLLLGLVLARLAVTSRQSARAAAVGEAQRLAARFHALVQHASDVVALADVDSRVRYITPSAGAMLDVEPAALEARPLLDLLHPDDAARAVAELSEVVSASGSARRAEFRIRRADGTYCETEVLLSNMLDVPDVAGIVFTIRDIGDRKALERALTFQALHDPLTGLANRTLFIDRVEHALTRRGRSRRGVAVLFIDLDDFKKINDSYGHGIGDRLLVEAAGRVTGCLRAGDTAARLGGDEFAVLVEDAHDAASIEAIAGRIAEDLRRPFVLEGFEACLSASVGIALGGSAGLGRDELLRNADLAMYVAKARGKHRCEMFRPSMHEDVRQRLQLEADMRHALERSEFEVYYQPIWLTSTRQIVGVEALVRWRHPRLGLVAPAEFIGLAEETGLIVPIGELVIHEACGQAAAWDRAGGCVAGLSLAVNLSPRQLRDAGLVRTIAAELAASGLPPGRLNLEITESVLVDENPAIVELLGRLKALGVRMSIDDFGTGYSSLSYLRRLPIDTLKIAKPFVDVVMLGSKDEALAQAVVSLGRSLELDVVAEGVELEDQLTALRAIGCDLGQGFLVGRPVPATELPSLAAEAPRATAA